MPGHDGYVTMPLAFSPYRGARARAGGLRSNSCFAKPRTDAGARTARPASRHTHLALHLGTARLWRPVSVSEVFVLPKTGVRERAEFVLRTLAQ